MEEIRVLPKDLTRLPSVEGLPAWKIVRAIRRRKGLSQRAFAELAEVPASTISRIEAQRVQPRFDTMEALLRAAGLVFIVADAGKQYDPVPEDRLSDRLRDAADRHTPAHLPFWLIKNEYDPPWWGWGRIAWSMKDPTVPTHTYYQRPKF